MFFMFLMSFHLHFYVSNRQHRTKKKFSFSLSHWTLLSFFCSFTLTLTLILLTYTRSFTVTHIWRFIYRSTHATNGTSFRVRERVWVWWQCVVQEREINTAIFCVRKGNVTSKWTNRSDILWYISPFIHFFFTIYKKHNNLCKNIHCGLYLRIPSSPLCYRCCCCFSFSMGQFSFSIHRINDTTRDGCLQCKCSSAKSLFIDVKVEIFACNVQALKANPKCI